MVPEYKWPFYLSAQCHYLYGQECAGAYHRYVLSRAYILEWLTVYYLLSILYKNLACYRKPTKSVISSDKIGQNCLKEQVKVKNRCLMLTRHAPKKPTFCLTIMMDLNIFNFGCNFKLSSPFTGWDNYWVPGTPQWSLLPVYLVSFGKSSFQSIAYSFYHNWTKFTRGDCGRVARGIFFEESLLQWSILAPFELLLGGEVHI